MTSRKLYTGTEWCEEAACPHCGGMLLIIRRTLWYQIRLAFWAVRARIQRWLHG